jgi:hypothetical protein
VAAAAAAAAVVSSAVGFFFFVVIIITCVGRMRAGNWITTIWLMVIHREDSCWRSWI